ncbi:hypothetical protein AMTRI_Chr01g131450 [Amborella trichopoda]
MERRGHIVAFLLIVLAMAMAMAMVVRSQDEPAMAMVVRSQDEPDCENDINQLTSQCLEYVKKDGPQLPPSGRCCSAVQAANMPCVCKHVTKEIDQYISVTKVIYVAKHCNRPLPSGTKCGNKKPCEILFLRYWPS